MIPTTCLKIEHPHVAQGGQELTLSSADLVRLIQSYPRGLKSFRLVMPDSGHEQIFSALTQTSATTLKSVHFEHFYISSTASMETFICLRQECALLGDFRVSCHCSRSAGCPHAGLRNLLPNATNTRTPTITTSSIFELPPVLDLICQNIWMDDINTCRLVCKDWASLFEAYRWKIIHVDTPSLGLRPNGERNSARIWRLAITARRLMQLLLLKNDQGHGRGQGKYHCDDVNNGNNINIDRALLSHLRCLDINSSGNYVSADIDDLNEAIKSVTRPKADKTRNAAENIRDSDRQYEWKQFQSLRNLSVDCQWGTCESWVHHPNVRSAPHLRRLKLGCCVDVDGEDENNDNAAFAGY
ncbi:hypothetical protein BG015_000338 [Linnemannia schmuckeri]|uniref:F-box domain-containing protein n=1 Tax=Linnemannia schmuckeri TaxID=64567 RepID=A0A9P5S7S8_9FUNG|nr:hypothetical protein BG015_000338 [Linnemannia schmuckeri]